MTPTAIDPEQAGFRRDALIVYGLYVASYFVGITALIGVIIAYLKRGDARGTAWESHFSNQILIFWTVLVVGLIGGFLTLILIGWLVLVVLAVWSIWRVVKGIVRALDGAAYR